MGKVMTDNLAEHYKNILLDIGEDTDRDGIKNTPVRAASAFREMTQGYNQDIDEVFHGALFDSESEGMVVVKDIEMYSLCEHHLVPFFGKCHIAYLPDGKVIGLSKVARFVDVFARRLQIQENLTKQIGDTVMKYTKAKGVAVVIEAQHLCMMARGVAKQNSVTQTSYMLGEFLKSENTRQEFMHLVRSP
jgi:GTP cyclohydrolase I